MGTNREGLVTLFRPVGPKELDLIAKSGWTRFPPRLPEQPIFYPVCNERYACEIAERRNAPHSGVGYVTRFNVRARFLEGYERQIVGGRHHEEYWIPADELEAFNDAIVGNITRFVLCTAHRPRRATLTVRRRSGGAPNR